MSGTRLQAKLLSATYERSEGKLVFRWLLDQTGNLNQLLLSDRCCIRFTPPPAAITESEIADMFVGILGPHLASKAEVLDLSIPFAMQPDQAAFWTRYIGGLVPSCRIAISASPISTQSQVRATPPRTGSLGLYFGGGVESLNLLSLLRHQSPYLLTVDGPHWMNSDYGKSSIKLELQHKLAREYKVSFLRVWTDARLLFNDGDPHVNRYVTGTLMYYTLLPLLRLHSVSVCIFGAEMEYAQVEDAYDQSIHPRHIHRVVRPPNPPILPALTAIPKVRLLSDLYERAPEFLAYLYSCFSNTSRRWCGDCGKCRRISRFCEVIGIPKHLIGMQEDIPAGPEDGELSRMYRENCEKFSRENASTRA
jgi:hypothetical protein